MPPTEDETPRPMSAEEEAKGAASMPLPWDGHQQKLALHALRATLDAARASAGPLDVEARRGGIRCATVGHWPYKSASCSACQALAAARLPAVSREPESFDSQDTRAVTRATLLVDDAMKDVRNAATRASWKPPAAPEERPGE